jgi:MYXO-CTERM domain-containing protein
MGRAVLLVLLLPYPQEAAAQRFDLRIDAPPSFDRLAERLRRVEPAALDRALAAAGLELPPRVYVTLLQEDDPRVGAVPRWIVARAFDVDTIVIFPSRISAYPYDSLESVFLHEITHLALNARAGGRPLPRWFHEGVAVSVESGWGIGSQARLLLAAARGPAIDDVTRLFRSESQPDTTTAYLLAAALVEDVRARHGLDAPGRIAGHVSRGAGFEDAFSRETGEGVDAAAARAWRAYRGLRWLPVVTGAAGLWGWILVLAFVAFAVRIRRRRERRRRWQDEEGPDPDDPSPWDGRVH